jgi:integrase/recombinase XerD
MLNTNYKEIKSAYNVWLTTLGFSAGLVKGYTENISVFFIWLQQNNIHHITQLTQTHITTYITYLQIRPNKRTQGVLSVSHLNHNFAAIDKLLQHLHQVGLHTAPIPSNYRMPVDKQAQLNNIHPFTKDEIKTLQANINNTYLNLPYNKRELKHQELNLIFALYYACGLRRTEGYKLTINDINFNNKTIFIKQGKNYKDRIVPMNTGVYNTLQHYIYNYRNLQKVKHNRLFISSTSTLANSLKHLQQITNDPIIQNKKLYLHILRHSIATHLLQNGMPIETIALFLGHNSLESTQIYTHIINK